MPAWGVFLGKWGFTGSKQPQVLSLKEQTEPCRKHEATPGQKSLLGISDVFLGQTGKGLRAGETQPKNPEVGLPLELFVVLGRVSLVVSVLPPHP